LLAIYPGVPGTAATGIREQGGRLARAAEAPGRRVGAGVPRGAVAHHPLRVRPLPVPAATLRPRTAALAAAAALSAGPIAVRLPALRPVPGPRPLGDGMSKSRAPIDEPETTAVELPSSPLPPATEPARNGAAGWPGYRYPD